MKKFFTIPLVIYPCSLMVAVGMDDKTLKKKLASRISEEDFDTHLKYDLPIRARTAFLGDNTSIITFKTWNGSSEHYGIMQHELFHVVDFTLSAMGLTLSESSNEAYAYLMGYLSEKVHEKLFKK